MIIMFWSPVGCFQVLCAACRRPVAGLQARAWLLKGGAGTERLNQTVDFRDVFFLLRLVVKLSLGPLILSRRAARVQHDARAVHGGVTQGRYCSISSSQVCGRGSFRAMTAAAAFLTGRNTFSRCGTVWEGYCELSFPSLGGKPQWF